MDRLEELKAQKEALEREIATLIQQKRQEAIEQAKKLIADFALKPEELFKIAPASGKKVRSKPPAKYRDPATGKTWTGQGRAPPLVRQEQPGRVSHSQLIQNDNGGTRPPRPPFCFLDGDDPQLALGGQSETLIVGVY